MKTKIILMALAVALCVAAFAALRLAKPGPSAQPQVEDASFGKNNLSRMQPDTLAGLMRRAYGSSLRAERDAKAVKLEWNAGAGNSPAAFYNRNEALPQVGGQGFTLQVNGSTVRAAFDIQQDGTVNVPNDVLMSMTQRLSNSTP